MSESPAIEKKKRIYNSQPTLRQKALAREIVEAHRTKKPPNKTTLVANVGYSEKSAKHKSHEIMTSKGVQKELNSLGFNVENAKRVVAEILEDSEQDAADRLRATDQIFRVHGEYQEKDTAKVLIVNVSAPAAAKYQIQATPNALQSPTSDENTKEDTR